MRKIVCLFLAVAMAMCWVVFGFSGIGLADVPLETTPLWKTTGNYDSSDVALGDFDYDGDLDLASFGEDNIIVYRNEQGELNTTAYWTSVDATSGLTGQVVWADINNDNYPELFTSVGMYENSNGVLSDTAVWTNLSTALKFTLGRVNPDVFVDLIVANSDIVELYENTAGVIDDIPDWNDTGYGFPKALALGDVDSDNRNELAVAYANEPLRIYDNVGGSLTDVSIWSPTLTDSIGELVWGDINNDDYPELFVCTQPFLGGDPNRMYLNSAGTLETTPSWNSTVPSYATDAKFADMDGDGDLDLLVSNIPYLSIITYVNGTEFVYLNENGIMDESHDWSGPYQDQSYGMDVGDVDGDGNPDVLVANREDLLQTYPGRVLMYKGLAPNNPPQITSVSAEPLEPETGEETTVTVQATDPDDDTLQYDFSVESGNGTIVSETDNAAVWRAPDEAGNYTVNITVSDGEGGHDYREFQITVVEPAPSEDGAPFFSLDNIWFLLILIIIIVVIIAAIVAGVARRRRGSLEEDFPPPPPPPPPPEE
ncbi:MAG: VCBS repeat-containing protein [Thermoplasmata archaeon]|nr:VCBS repeat-containing protein [Thermoplasmata archaeon]